MAEGLPFARSVDIASLIQILGNGLQASEKDEHGITHVHPYLHEYNVAKSMREASKEHVLITEQPVIQHVYRTAHRVEHHPPDQGNNRNPKHNREEKYGAIEIIAAQPLIQQNRYEQGDPVLHNRYYKHENQCIRNGAPTFSRVAGVK